MVSVVPNANSDYENEIIYFIEEGGKVIFYGSVDRASQRFLDLINIDISSPVSGELDLHSDINLDSFEEFGYSGKINHRELISAGAIDTVIRDSARDVRPLAYAGDKVIGTYAKSYAWLRGTSSNKYIKGRSLLTPDNQREYFLGEILMRYALDKLGYSIAFEKADPTVKNPVVMISRCDNAYMFSVYTPNTTAATKFKFPLGAPVLLGYEAKIKEGYSIYNFPRAEHRECRIFIGQQDGIVSCREIPPVSYQMRRRIKVSGLKNATIRFFAEKYCENNIDAVCNSNSDYYFTGDSFDGGYKTDEYGTYYEANNITGEIVFSMPVKSNN
jgi:hypothetical protein